MHGREDGESRTRIPHMWSVASRALAGTLGVDSCSSSSSSNSFIKDGRKIKVGDCALFKPPHGSPPFIGIIRSFTSDKENNLKLGVNWLYRPAEVILGKGVVFEAAPNEVFYTFRRDEAPAASLLHPCKVAFFPKGVELPSGVSSFVCRRVYDTTNKRLWWLADKNRTNDQQEELAWLLQKSRLEMHATDQPQQGNHSPKPVNGATVTSPLKHSSDSMQNSSTFSSYLKGKKRDSGDQTSEAVKRECLIRTGDENSVLSRSESVLNVEVAKISEKGGLVDYESVEKLVQLMQPQKSQKKMGLGCRCLLADIIAGTDRIDCLNWFVQLRGVPLLDEWLQDVHKGKVGNLISTKDSDKSVEDFLLILLCALDKLPVDLNALQMCNIGKSVNHLRSHKNLEIQKKARSLVDTWKKRVKAELNSNVAKSALNQAVSLPAKSRHDVPHAVYKHTSGPAESTLKNVGHLVSVKSGLLKPVHGDNTPRALGQKSSPSQSSVITNYKEGQGELEPPLNIVKEEKSSSSSQSLTNSQCSSDHARNIVLLGKEGTRISTGGSKRNKTTVSSRRLKSANGHQVTGHSSVQKESRSSRVSSLLRSSPAEKLANSATCENDAATPVVESSSHKIIVKIPNRGRSPGQSANTGLMEDPSCRNSRASSPEKHDHPDATLREKNNAYQIDEVDVIPAASPYGKQYKSGNAAENSPDLAKTADLSTRKDTKTRRSSDSYLSSMNALIESCVKYSEENASIPVGDDSGMNLLASVATEEIARSGVASPTISPSRNNPIVNDATTDHEGGKRCNDGEQCRASIVSVPSACIVGKIDRCRDHMKSTVSKNKGHCHALDIKQIDNGLLPSQDEVKDERQSEGQDKAQEDLLIHLPSIANDEKNDPDQGLNANVLVNHKPPSTVTDSEPLCKNGGNAVDSSGAHEILVLQHSAELKAEDAHEAEVCSNHDDGGIKKIKGGNDASLCPPTMEGSALASVGSDQKAECGGGDIPGKKERDVGSHVSSKNSHVNAVHGERKADSVSCVPNASVSGARLPDTDRKLEFDLNEGLTVEEVKNGEPVVAAFTIPVSMLSPSQSAISSVSSAPSPAVTIAAAAKRSFIPPDDLLRNKTELGWKGSAATSAFRPAEPRKVTENATSSCKLPRDDSMASKSDRPVLDIDLNVTDEGVLQDIYCQSSTQEIAHKDCKNGGLELDLNRVNDAPEFGHWSESNFQTVEFLASPLMSSSIGTLSSEFNTKRNFDLNDGPAADESIVAPAGFNQNAHSNITPQPSFGIRMKNSAVRSLSSWFSPGTTYTAATSSTGLPNISAIGSMGPSRVLGGPATTSFNSDFYAGSVLSSSPAVPFTTPLQYPFFPYGTSFPLPTSSMSAVAAHMDPSGGRFCPPARPTQVVGMSATVSPQYPYPCITGVSDASRNGVVESSRKWGRQGLDLNCGPGGVDIEGIDEALLMTSRQLPATSSHTVVEQPRAYQAASGVLKRKEPEGGWDTDRLSYKQV